MNILKQKLNKTKDKLTLPLKRRQAIKTNNAELAYEVAKQSSKNLQQLQQIVIESNDAFIMNAFARNVKGANVKALSDTVAKTQDFHQIYNFASDTEIKGADIEVLQNAIIQAEYCPAKTIYEFARDVQGADIAALSKAMARTCHIAFINEFAKNIPNADINVLQKTIIETKDPCEIYKFAKNAKIIDKKELSCAIAEYGDLEYIKAFANNIPNADVKLISNIIATKYNINDIIDFANSVKKADIETLQQAVIASKNYNDIKLFALKVAGANIHTLTEAVIKLYDCQLMIDFAKNIPNADIGLFENYVINHYKGHIYEFALGVKGANVQRLQKALENYADSYEHALWDIYSFARDVPGARCDGEYLLDILQKINAKSSKPSSRIGTSALYLANNYPTLDLKTLQNLVIANGDFCTLYDFALNVKGADIKAIETAMVNNFLAITYDDFAISASYDLLRFAKEIPNANSEKIVNALITYVIVTKSNEKELFENIIEASKMCTEGKVNIAQKIASTNNATLIYDYARKTNPDKQCLSILEDGIMQTGNMLRVGQFAKFVPGANIKKLQQCVIDSKEEVYMFAFAEEVSGSDKQLIEKHITDIDEARRRRNLLARYLSW